MLVAAPVRTGNRHEFKRLDFAGRKYVRTRAEVGKIALREQRNFGVFGQRGNEFDFIIFAEVAKHFQSVGAADNTAFQLEILLDDIFHFGFNVCQILVGELAFHINIVIETGVDSRTDSEFNIFAVGAAVKVPDSLRHNMRRGVAERVQCLGAVDFRDTAVLRDNFFHDKISPVSLKVVAETDSAYLKIIPQRVNNKS